MSPAITNTKPRPTNKANKKNNNATTCRRPMEAKSSFCLDPLTHTADRSDATTS